VSYRPNIYANALERKKEGDGVPPRLKGCGLHTEDFDEISVKHYRIYYKNPN